MADPGQGGGPKKVFVAYPRNPEGYEQLAPSPAHMQTAQAMADFEQRQREFLTAQKSRIDSHMKLVNEFVRFLQAHYVEVMYDQTVMDTGCANILKWSEARIEEADYMILIATPSLEEFLKYDVPPEEEPLFVGDLLYNYIQDPTKPILSVFLNTVKNVDLLPGTLRAGNKYQVNCPFYLPSVESQQGRGDDLEQLYAQLTGQNRYAPPPPVSSGPMPLRRIGRLGRSAIASTSQSASSQTTHSRLSVMHIAITPMQITAIADKQRFNCHWRLLAPLLGLTAAQIEACEVDSGGYGQAEQCHSMLTKWREAGLYSSQPATVARLATIVHDGLRNTDMIEVLGQCIQ